MSGIGSDGEKALGAYGLSLGMAFQIADDILDFVGTEEELGKPVGGDLRQGTLTLPTLWALDHLADGSALRRVVEGEDVTAEELGVAVRLVAASPAIEFAQAEAERFARLAKDGLVIFPD